jgi:S-adenosylmethionine-diacylglycerol 3-amino-3-carboxypropyl transferase
MGAPTEVAARAAFSEVRYAQCWEDADILVEALRPGPGKTCVSIASAGDNTFALLAEGAERVVALDLNPAQLACVELRRAAYARLDHAGLLRLLGSAADATPGERTKLYSTLRDTLAGGAREFWDARPEAIRSGAAGAGKLENFFRIFRRRVLPFIHGRRRVEELFEPRPHRERRRFYEQRWDSWRWRMLFRLFFSRRVMGALGRDPAFFRYVEGPVPDKILERTRHALTELEPDRNPYLRWILKGHHVRRAEDAAGNPGVLPRALRAPAFPENRGRLGARETSLQTVGEFLDGVAPGPVDAFNLSDIFEYMSEENMARILRSVVRAAKPGARVAYWNMLAPRGRPESMADVLRPLPELAERLFHRDKAWFYSRFVVEEVLPDARTGGGAGG